MRTIRTNPIRLLSSKAVMLAIALPSLLLAQPVSAQAADNVTNPQATVPAVSYRSVFKETSLGVEKDTEDWRKANDEVGKFLRGHVDILKWEDQAAAKVTKGGIEKPMSESDAMKKPSVPQPTNTLAPKPDRTKPIAAPADKH